MTAIALHCPVHPVGRVRPGHWRASVPPGLTVFRLLLGPVLVLAAWHGWPGWTFVGLLTAGLLTDVYDGVLARRWGVATATLRRFDSVTDVAFYLAVLSAAWHQHPAVFLRHTPAIVGLVGLEATVQAVCLARWGVCQATHSYLAKLWGLALWVAFVALLGFGVAGPLAAAVGVGVVADLEVLLILVVSRRPPVDVRTVRAAWRLRRSGLPTGRVATVRV